MENQFLGKLIKNAPHLKWFPFPSIQPVNAWLSLRPTAPTASSHPSHLSSLHPSFALLLSPGGNYLHKSFFALWFAPFHKWRLSLFNRGGFASHVKAYNVAGPWFLHTPPPPPGLPPSIFFPVGLGLLGRGGEGRGGERGPPRLRLTGPEEDCSGSGFRSIDLAERGPGSC